jgi:antirestriction protein ArdC
MQDKTKAAVDKLMDLFTGEADMAQAITQVALIRRQKIGAPSENWSLGNNLIMLMNDTADARTFKQWKAVGRYPVKGSKAFQILRPVKKVITETDEETGETKEKVIVIGFAGVNVFRYEDTDGEEIERPDYKPVQLPPLMDVAKALEVSVDYAPGQGGVLGYYVPGQKHIRMLTHGERTWFHELAHAADDKVGTLKGTSYKSGEVVAEMAAAVLCELYGFGDEREHLGSRSYIERYAGENAGKAAMKVLARVEKVLDLILSTEAQVNGVAA